jgi:hypothetical protein
VSFANEFTGWKYFPNNCPTGQFLYRQRFGESIRSLHRKRDNDKHPSKRKTKMSQAQANYIASLTRQLGLGRFADDGIKAVLGRKPINMTQAKASEVIDALKARLAAN